MRNFLLALPAALTTFYDSCETRPPVIMHTPVAVQAAPLQKKGDVQLRAIYAYQGTTDLGGESRTLDKVTSLDAQAAVALTDHLQVLGFGSFKKERNGYEPDGQSNVRRKHEYTRNLGGLALGYFSPLRQGGKLHYSVLLGYGAGNYKADIFTAPAKPATYYFNNTASHPFLLLSLYEKQGVFNYGIGLRYTLAGFENIKTNFTAVELEAENLHRLKNGRASLLEGYWNVGLTPRQLPWLSFELQTTMGGDLSGRLHITNAFLFSGGLRFNLNQLWHTQK